MYQSVHGRFTAVDPLLASALPGNPQSWNRYIYVGNNPLFWVDRTGLIWGKNEAGQEVVAESNPIQDLVQSTGGALDDSLTGLQIGARNAINAGTQPLGPVGDALGIPNPLELSNVEPANARQAAYAFIGETGVTAMATAGAGSAIAGPASAGSSLSVVPQATANVVPRTSSVLGHIFKNTEGHVNPVTNASQVRFINLFERVANNPGNLNPNVLSSFQRTNPGFQGFSQTYRNGQVWAHVRGVRIFDAGVNRIPR